MAASRTTRAQFKSLRSRGSIWSTPSSIPWRTLPRFVIRTRIAKEVHWSEQAGPLSDAYLETSQKRPLPDVALSCCAFSSTNVISMWSMRTAHFWTICISVSNTRITIISTHHWSCYCIPFSEPARIPSMTADKIPL